jgi:hypothetical protein
MAVYYHGTWPELLPDILRVGLDPALMSPEYLEEDEEPMPFVFLSESRRIAEDFGEVILRVDLPDSLDSQVRWDLGEFGRMPVLIPAWCLRVEP